MQLQVYAHAARERAGAEQVVARYAWLNPNHAQWELDSSNSGDEAALEHAVGIAGDVRAGVESGDFRVNPQVTPCPSYCAFMHICRVNGFQPMEAVDLTLQQQAIVNARGQDVFVVAGAGSGKTSVLVSRYVELLSECGIPQIAAVTFTDAAATEMRERVRREVLSRDDLAGRRADLDKAVIGTIHSLCRQLLRENPVESAIDPPPPGSSPMTRQSPSA